MLKHYVVCFIDCIENRINDDDIFFDGDGHNGDIDTLYDVLAESEEAAKTKFLRWVAEKKYSKDQIDKRVCVARVIRRIAANEVLQLPREAVKDEHIGDLILGVYDALSPNTGDMIRQLVNSIDINEYAKLLGRDAVIALYVDVYRKDVFVQELNSKLSWV